MNYAKAIFLIHDGVRAVKVRYLPKADYNNGRSSKSDNVDNVIFKTLDQSLKEGDLVIVPTQTRYKMTVCKVSEIDVDPELEAPGDCRWIIDKVDTSDYERLQTEEAEAVSHIRRAEDHRKRKELRKSLMESAAAEGIKALPIYSVEETPGDKPD